MPADYEVDPQRIEKESFRRIRELTDLNGFDAVQQQVVMRVVHSLGLPGVAAEMRFSEEACAPREWKHCARSGRFSAMSKCSAPV